jgi:hypothetical protein
MKQVTTYVGIDAHKKDLFVAMLMGNESKPVTRQLANAPSRASVGPEARARLPGAGARVLRSGAGRLRVVTAGHDVSGELRRGRPALIPRKPGERVKRRIAAMRASWWNWDERDC